MPLNSPMARTKNNIIFGTQDDTPGQYEDKDSSCELEQLDNRTNDSAVRTPSFIVELFEEMFGAVLLSDSHLLSYEEKIIFPAFQSLSYEARYLLLHLALGIPEQWQRISTLKCEADIGDDTVPAIVELCRPIMSSDMDVKIKTGEEEKKDIKIKIEVFANDVITTKNGAKVVIDLSLDDSDEEEKPLHIVRGIKCKQEDHHVRLHAKPPNIKVDPCIRTVNIVAGPSRHNAAAFNQQDKLDLTCFCHCESSMSLSDLLECLTTHELKALAKQLKIKTTQNRSSLISNLLVTSSAQTILNFVSMGKVKAKFETESDGNGRALRQTTLGFRTTAKAKGKGKVIARTQEERLRDIVLELLEKCVRINYDVFKLFRRVHMIYFRGTEYLTSILLPPLLTSSRKRNYAEYTCERNSSIWPDRAALLMYEESLEIQARIDKVLDGTSTTAVRGRGEEVKVDSVRVQEARMAKKILEEVFPKWKELVSVKEKQAEVAVGVERIKAGLERFESGYIFTRIVQKGAQALGVLKEYEGELEVLEALLGQKVWRRGRRGKWYERRAAILMTHLCEDEKSKVLTRAIEGVKEALMDDDTSLAYRPSLVRRLVRLEKMLGFPPEARCICEVELKVKEVTVEAIRLWNTMDGGRLATPIKSEDGKEFSTPIFARAGKAIVVDTLRKRKKHSEIPKTNKWKGKSVWLGRGDEEVTVATRALQYYEELGYKGYHSESHILTTVFALLFWDIIFAAIPGAFETQYQYAPLDMSEDTFYYARKDLIAQRLTEIEEGGAKLILETHDALYREKKTWGVGVRWDVCDSRDLMEIAECLGGKSLSIICHLFCEDYAGRSTGVPDLIIRNADEGVCKFVQVKGPGDSLQENQKIWIDVLVRAGTAVEICKIVEAGQESGKKQRGKSKGLSMAKGKEAVKKTQVQSDSESEPQSEDEDQADQLDDDPWQPHIEIAVEQRTGRYHTRGTKRRAPDDELTSPQSELASSSSSPVKRGEPLVLFAVKKRRLGGRHSSP